MEVLDGALKVATDQSNLRYNCHRVKKSLKHNCVYTVMDFNVVVNRDYKPTGLDTKDFVDYADYISSHSVKLPGDGEEFREYLFNDITAPWCSEKHLEEYIEKLKVLLAFQ